MEGGTFLNYRIDRLNLDSANVGFWGRYLKTDGHASDDTSYYIKFDSSPYETDVNEMLSNSEYTAKALPVSQVDLPPI